MASEALLQLWEEYVKENPEKAARCPFYQLPEKKPAGFEHFYTLTALQAYLSDEFPESNEKQVAYKMDSEYFFDIQLCSIQSLTEKQRAKGISAQTLKKYAFPETSVYNLKATRHAVSLVLFHDCNKIKSIGLVRNTMKQDRKVFSPGDKKQMELLARCLRYSPAGFNHGLFFSLFKDLSPRTRFTPHY